MASKSANSFPPVVAPPAAGRLEIPDPTMRSLVYRITEKGAKSWAVRYRPRGMTQRRETLPGTVAVKEARQRAREILAAAGRGIDLPAQERAQVEEQAKAAERAITVETFLRRYVSEHCEPTQRRPEIVRRLFEMHVIPKIGGKPLGELRRAELVELLDDLQNGKGMAAQVNRVRSQLVAALTWAVERELLDANPAFAIKRRKIEKPRERVLSPDELVAIWKAADTLPEPAKSFAKMLMLSGQRRDEIRRMEWSEIKDGVWTLPASRSKGKRDHELPLSPAMVDILASLPKLGSAVFTINGKRPYAGHDWTVQYLRGVSGVTGWTFHDLRRTCRSGLAELGIREEVAERVLNHAQGKGLVAVYNRHSYRPEMLSALTAWANHIAHLTGAAPSNVTELRRA